MTCPFCGWEVGHAGGVDPCDVLVAFDDHLDEHAADLVWELTSPLRRDSM